MRLNSHKANNWQWSNIEVSCSCEIGTGQRYIHFEPDGGEKGEEHTNAGQDNNCRNINKALHRGKILFCSLIRKMALNIKIGK